MRTIHTDRSVVPVWSNLYSVRLSMCGKIFKRDWRAGKPLTSSKMLIVPRPAQLSPLRASSLNTPIIMCSNHLFYTHKTKTVQTVDRRVIICIRDPLACHLRRFASNSRCTQYLRSHLFLVRHKKLMTSSFLVLMRDQRSTARSACSVSQNVFFRYNVSAAGIPPDEKACPQN